MSKRLKPIVLAIVGTISFYTLAGPASAADLTIRFAWAMPPHTAVSDQGERIAKNIEKMSDGKIQVQTYPSGSLATETTMSQAIANNKVNMGYIGMHWWSNQEPALAWDHIPFLVTDPNQLLSALHGRLGNDINALIKKHGVQVIGWGFYGYSLSYINSKHPVKVPSDLKGLKMRSDGKLNADFIKSQGAIPVAMDSSEVYTALQRGTLDGACSGLSSFVSRKWYEAGKYVTAIHYVPTVYPIQTNISWWKGLTEEQRNIITKAIEKTEKPAVKEINASFNKHIKTMKKAGLEIYRPSDANLKIWKKKAESNASKNYRATAGKPGQKILKDAQAAMQDNTVKSQSQ